MTIWTDIRDFFFPRLCVVCGKPLHSQEEGLCIYCDASLPLTRIGNTPSNPLEKNFWGRFPIQRASALYWYAKSGNVAQILYAMKYFGHKKLCRMMGNRMAEALIRTGFFSGIDYLVPVPLHPARFRQRGYNQSEELARGISDKTLTPILVNAVKRTRNNTTQTHKSSLGRWENSNKLFCASTEAAQLKNKHILVIDDVLTTGATITACADALSGIEGIQISILTLAWTQ